MTQAPEVNFVVSLAGGIIGMTIANVAHGFGRAWLRDRRSGKLERMVAAELLSRGLRIRAMQMQTVGDVVPPRPTPAAAKAVADQIEITMRQED
jgi:hypothetical protein